ncbi:hypothetical protein [Enterococcus faecium]|uniref:hypothetical protein n=1 Tax=Enterococcus faecium TaxID=1352 RepID=UPI0006B27D91|nr:hypothetical protein [Enterococcus faecium]
MKIGKLGKYVLAGAFGTMLLVAGSDHEAHADTVCTTPAVCYPVTDSTVVKDVTYKDRDDHFKFVEDRRGTGTKYSGYKLDVKRDLESNRLYVTLITDPGSSLGTIENSIEEYHRKNVGEGKVEYTFYFTLFNYQPIRTIHINVSPVNS